MQKNLKLVKQNTQLAQAVIEIKTTEELQNAHKFIEALLKYRAIQKQRTTYTKGLKKALEATGQDKIFLNYNLDGTVTGRLSCVGYKVGGVNLGLSFHTMPRDKKSNIRSVFSAPEGWIFNAADYSAMEMRVMASISCDTNLQEAFIKGFDPHTYVASMIFKVPLDKVSKTQRQIAKSISFLIIYGGSAFKLANDMQIPLYEAEAIMQTYFERFPKVKQFKDIVEKFLVERAYIPTIFKRRRNLENVNSSDKQTVARTIRQALNNTVQSPANDILLFALLGICIEFESRGLRSIVCATVHDSIEWYSPPEELEETHEIVRYYMRENPLLKAFGVTISVPLEVDSDAGKSFGDMIEVKWKDNKIQNVQEILDYVNN